MSSDPKTFIVTSGSGEKSADEDMLCVSLQLGYAVVGDTECCMTGEIQCEHTSFLQGVCTGLSTTHLQSEPSKLTVPPGGRKRSCESDALQLGGAFRRISPAIPLQLFILGRPRFFLVLG